MPKFVLSNSKVNKYGFRVLTSGLDLDQFRKNPVMLYMHNRSILPIGKWVNIAIEGDNLVAEPEFDEKDEFAMKVKSKVDQGILNSASIGLDVLTYSEDPKDFLEGQNRPTVTTSRVNEVSIVDIPANGGAMRLSFANGLTLSGTISEDVLNSVLPIINLTDDMKELALALGLKADATESEILGAINKLKADSVKLKADASKVLVLMAEEKGLKKETIEKLAAADFESTLALVQETNVPEAPADDAGDTSKKDPVRLSAAVADHAKKNGNEKPKNERESWTLSDYEKKDPEALKVMIRTKPDDYAKLFKEAYGEECNLAALKSLTV